MTYSQPIFFRGIPYTAKKNYLLGTHRILTPEETWDKIAPLAPKVGITRMANITGLDRIGIPVLIAIRPQARTVTTAAGKGLSEAIARISGFMESLELYCAEECSFPILHLSYRQLLDQYSTIPLASLNLRKASHFHPDRPERWVLGWDLFKQVEVAAPLVSVTMNPHLITQDPMELISFSRGSNGLASGNHFLEALASGIYEVIERDAITCHLYAAQTSPYFPPCVRLDTIIYPSVQTTVDQLEKKGIKLFLFDCTLDTQVPVFMAMIYDLWTCHMGIFHGYGAHLDPEVAMIRAITEAVQCRTVLIAGTRDDTFSTHFQAQKKFDSLRQQRTYETFVPTIDASLYTSQASSTFEDDIHLLMHQLKHVGISQLIVHDLTHHELEIPVLRVIIPGLEGYKSSSYSPGKRASAFATQQSNAKNQNSHSLSYLHFPAGALT